MHHLRRPVTVGARVRRGGGGPARGAAVDEDAVLPVHVVELFRELGGVLEDARQRLDALLQAAIPVQDTRASLADPDLGGR